MHDVLSYAEYGPSYFLSESRFVHPPVGDKLRYINALGPIENEGMGGLIAWF